MLRGAGLRIGFLSNNSSMVVADVVAKLGHAGVAADPAEVLTSAVAAGALLGSSLPAGARVLVCAGPGVVEALTNVGLTLVREPPAAAVVVGFHRDFDYDELDRASRAIREGARFVATNLDATYPTADGMIPGTGVARRRGGDRVVAPSRRSRASPSRPRSRSSTSDSAPPA